jgi:hypothetical protein
LLTRYLNVPPARIPGEDGERVLHGAMALFLLAHDTFEDLVNGVGIAEDVVRRLPVGVLT